MDRNPHDERVGRVLLGYFRSQMVVTLALAALIVALALIIGELFVALVGLAVAAVAYVAYRAYADNV